MGTDSRQCCPSPRWSDSCTTSFRGLRRGCPHLRVAFGPTPKVFNETPYSRTPNVRAPCGRWNWNSVDIVTVENWLRCSVNACADLDKSPGKSSHLPRKNASKNTLAWGKFVQHHWPSLTPPGPCPVQTRAFLANIIGGVTRGDGLWCRRFIKVVPLRGGQTRHCRHRGQGMKLRSAGSSPEIGLFCNAITRKPVSEVIPKRAIKGWDLQRPSERPAGLMIQYRCCGRDSR